MILCDDKCIPCCDFCIHVLHEYLKDDYGIVQAGPIGCCLHRDYNHQEIAKACGECEDFHCFRAEEKL